MKAKDILLLNNTITQNPILARRAWFWRVASHICKNKIKNGEQYVTLTIKIKGKGHSANALKS